MYHRVSMTKAHTLQIATCSLFARYQVTCRPPFLLLLSYSCNNYQVTCSSTPTPLILLLQWLPSYMQASASPPAPQHAVLARISNALATKETRLASTCWKSSPSRNCEKTHWGMLKQNVKIYSKTSFLQGKFTIEDVLRWFGTEILVILKEKSFKSPAGEM